MGLGRLADRGVVKAALERFEAVAAELTALSVDALSADDLLAVLDRREAVARSSVVAEHRLIARLSAVAQPRELGAALDGRCVGGAVADFASRGQAPAG